MKSEYSKLLVDFSNYNKLEIGLSTNSINTYKSDLSKFFNYLERQTNKGFVHTS